MDSGTGNQPPRRRDWDANRNSASKPRGKHGKKNDLGRAAWAKNKLDRRGRNDHEQETKRRRVDKGHAPLPVYATKFSDDVLAAEERKPKKKVAVLVGYSGTGYRGMQLAHDQKTIEGDLFKAFVEAGAVSKVNADDPKKSSFVRCARTDKGVHAAGNIISLKLIIEDEDIVDKINEKLSPQIRVWGFERTNNSFSAYQLCDSRIYEYLIPSFAFLPPHPRSFLGRKCKYFAEKSGNLADFESRQAELRDFWDQVETERIRPILEEYDELTRGLLEAAIFPTSNDETEPIIQTNEQSLPAIDAREQLPDQLPDQLTEDTIRTRRDRLAEGGKRLRAAYIQAKRQYRIDKTRMERVQKIFAMFEGTKNYHNYTVEKTYKDPSAKRVIKSFILNPEAILINGTEWLSLKVHGQSFMMHQIRKMVGMVALIVRCGCDPVRLTESIGPNSISIPKAPSLGLLLERPVFDTYNKKAKNEYGKDPIDFDKFKIEMDEFKQREIYTRIYEEEEKDNIFGNFFNHIDNFQSEVFLFVTSGGIPATKTNNLGNDQRRTGAEADNEDSDEDEAPFPNDAAGDEG